MPLCLEDGFHWQKAKVDKQNSHRAREQRAFGTLLEQNVLSQVHKYDEVGVVNFGNRTEQLPQQAFRPLMRSPSIPEMSDVIGTVPSQKPTWWSPGVDTLSVEPADLSLMKWCKDNGKTAQVKDAWLGMLVKASHNILVRTVLKDKKSQCFWAGRPPQHLLHCLAC